VEQNGSEEVPRCAPECSSVGVRPSSAAPVEQKSLAANPNALLREKQIDPRVMMLVGLLSKLGKGFTSVSLLLVEQLP
jgi:hypothetical protein